MTTATPNYRRIRANEFIAVAIIIATVLLLYVTTLTVPYVFDDFFLILNNKLQHPNGLLDILNSGYKETRPLFHLTTALIHTYANSQPFYFHILNIALHAGNALLLLAILLFLPAIAKRNHHFSHWFSCVIACLVFLLHPLQTESVTYLSGRAGLGMSTFSLFAVLCFMGFRYYTGTRLARILYVGSILSCVFAMLFKENGIAAPLLVVMLDLLLVRNLNAAASVPPTPSKKRLLLYAPFVLSLVTIPILFLIFNSPHMQALTTLQPEVFRSMVTQPKIWLFIASSFLLPLWQNLDHDIQLVQSLIDPSFFGPALFCLGLSYAAWRTRKTAPMVLFGMLWSIICLFPTNGLFPFFDLLAERNLYLALAGPAIVVASLFESLWARLKEPPGSYAIALVVCAWLIGLGSLTYQRNVLWRSERTIWQDAAGKSPNKLRPVMNYGVSLASAREFDQAEPILKKAILMQPNNAQAQYNYGLLWRKLGELESAELHLSKALALNPNHIKARYFLASVYAELERPEKALAILSNGFSTKRFVYPVYRLASRLQAELGHLDAAEASLVYLRNSFPHRPRSYIDLCEFYVATNQGIKAKKAISTGMHIERHGLSTQDCRVKVVVTFGLMVN